MLKCRINTVVRKSKHRPAPDVQRFISPTSQSQHPNQEHLKRLHKPRPQHQLYFLSIHVTKTKSAKHNCIPGIELNEVEKLVGISALLFFFLLSFISLIADGPHHYHPACGHKGSTHLSPVHALQFFNRDASSALLQLVNQWLNFTYSRSHAFRYERKNTNPTLVRIELTTSVLADVQLTY